MQSTFGMPLPLTFFFGLTSHTGISCISPLARIVHFSISFTRSTTYLKKIHENWSTKLVSRSYITTSNSIVNSASGLGLEISCTSSFEAAGSAKWRAHHSMKPVSINGVFISFEFSPSSEILNWIDGN